MVDITQLTGEYAASWLPWIMIPLIFYILPFPVFAILFLWIEKEDIEEEITDIPGTQMMGNVTNME
ncbi:photosystem I subunit VIII [Calothrix parasitica NIES-267]|uniref:Photosystem I reaction center subunit VIII n=1 Tax=Calothrix parasitica NIES-267 TaxID=1973488 RepID=A0A1Z4LXJ3_9CYAN|nr:photosystem I subunit VIII [Calothrix parasitica NIES-267]